MRSRRPSMDRDRGSGASAEPLAPKPRTALGRTLGTVSRSKSPGSSPRAVDGDRSPTSSPRTTVDRERAPAGSPRSATVSGHEEAPPSPRPTKPAPPRPDRAHTLLTSSSGSVTMHASEDAPPSPRSTGHKPAYVAVATETPTTSGTPKVSTWRSASAASVSASSAAAAMATSAPSSTWKQAYASPSNGSSWRASLIESAMEPLQQPDDGGDGSGDILGAAVKVNEHVYTWGLKGIGMGKTPMPVALADVLGAGETVVSVACGAHHFVLVTSTRRCFTWGKGSHGQLGHSETRSVSEPRPVQQLEGVPVELVAAGGDQTLVTTADRECYYFGWAGNNAVKPQVSPVALPRLQGVPIKAAACGYHHVVVCSRVGDLWAWGSNVLGELAIATTEEFVPLPIEVDGVRKVVSVSAADNCTACVLQNGSVMYWGNNWIRGKPGVASKPLRIGFPRPVAHVALGGRHLVALGRLGEVWTLGQGESGQLGTGKLQFSPDPGSVVFRDDGSGNDGDAVTPEVPNRRPTLSTVSGSNNASASDAPAAAGSGGGVAPVPIENNAPPALSRSATAGELSERKKGMWEMLGSGTRKIFAREEITVPMAAVSCGTNFSAAVSKQGQVFFWGTHPATRAVHATPQLVTELTALCVGGVSCGSAMCAVSVELQDTAELCFHSYSPPILRAATVHSAFEFLFGAKGASSPLLDFIMRTLWPTMCDEGELLNALHWTWMTLDKRARIRVERFVADFIEANMRRLMASSSFSSSLRQWAANTGQEGALKLLDALPTLQSALTGSGSNVLPFAKMASAPDFLQFTPETIAEQLTLIDHRVLVPVTPQELMSLGWTKKDKEVRAPAIMAVTSRFNSFSDFVRGDILAARDSALRSRRMRLWIEVQKQCLNLNNFNAVMALSAALNSVPLRKLVRHDLIEVSRSHRRWLEFVDEQIMARNMKGYRAKLAAALQAREAAVPFLATHLGDLVFIVEGNPDTVEGGLINMWKRYLMARQLSQVRQMQDQAFSALKKVDDLFRFLSLVQPEFDERKCDELAESYVQEAEALLAGATTASTPATGSTPPPSQGAAAARRIVADDNPERLRQEGESDPETRLLAWNSWVQSYITRRDDYLLAWCRSTALEGCIRGLLMVPLTPAEEPVFETLCTFFLVKGVDVRRLIELLRAVALTEPERETREAVVALVVALKHNAATIQQAPEPASQVAQTTSGASAGVEGAPSVSALDSGVRALLGRGSGLAVSRQQYEQVQRSRGLATALRDRLQAPVLAQRQELKAFLAQRDSGKAERSNSLVTADNNYKQAEKKLAVAVAREAELRAALEAAQMERLRLESDLDRLRQDLESTSRQQNQRIAILNANIEHAEHENAMRDRALQAADALLDNVVATADAWAKVDTSWVEPLDARLAELDALLRSLEEKLTALHAKYRQLNSADASMRDQLDRLRAQHEKVLSGPFAALEGLVAGLPAALSASRQHVMDQQRALLAKIDNLSRDLQLYFSDV